MKNSNDPHIPAYFPTIPSAYDPEFVNAGGAYSPRPGVVPGDPGTDDVFKGLFYILFTFHFSQPNSRHNFNTNKSSAHGRTVKIHRSIEWGAVLPLESVYFSEVVGSASFIAHGHLNLPILKATRAKWIFEIFLHRTYLETY